MVTLVPVTVQLPKEIDEVLQLLVATVKTVRSGQDYSALVGSLLKAIEGVGALPEEMRDALPQVLAAVGLRMSEVVMALITPPVVPTVK